MKKAMRLLSLAALFVATTALAGCEKDYSGQPEENTVLLTTTVSFEGNEATKALTNGGVKTFANGEKIAVVYENTSNAMVKTEVTLESANISADRKSVTFTVSATNPKSGGTFRLIYPASMAGDNDVDYTKLANQDGTMSTISSNYDLGYYSGTLDGENFPANPALSNPLVIAKFVLKHNSASINSSVTMLFIGDGTNTYYITRSGSADSICVAMRPVESSQTLIFHALAGSDRYERENVTGKTLAAGHIVPIGLGMTKLQAGATFGAFTVSGSATRHFAHGNLWYKESQWKFRDNQYDYNTSWSESDCDLFYWETTNTYGAGQECQTSSGSSSDQVNWGTNISFGTWSTPSKDDWVEVFNGRSSVSTKYAKGKVCGKNGVILFSDRYTHPIDLTGLQNVNVESANWDGNNYDAAAWEKMEAAGAVFLPAAGNRYGTVVDDDGSYGYYWSSTADESDDYSAYCLSFYDDILGPGYYYRGDGRSVRLVCE